MNEWKECKLGDLAIFQRGHDLPKLKMNNGSIPVAGSNGIIGYHNKATTKGPGITIGRSGNIGTPKFYKDDFWAHNTTLYVKDYKENEAKFIYYFLCTIDFSGLNAGSAVPTLNRNHIHEIPILLPSLLEQQAIAGMLSCLDDKIDLLHRQNKTLEGMAQTLWRKMFVEEAKPEWDEVSLLDIIDLVGGGTPKTEMVEYWGGSIHWLTAKDITANHKGFIVQTDKTITDLGLRNSSTNLIPKYSTIISARGTVGNYCILSTPMTFSQSCYGILPKIKECYFFTYLLIAYIVDDLKLAAYGSIFDTITTNTFKEQKIMVPSSNQIAFFEERIKPYFNKIHTNSIQIRTLTRMRDNLLPKLMSGQLKVKL